MDAWPSLFEQVCICDTPLQPSQRPYPHRRSLGKMMDIAHVRRRDTAPDTPEYWLAPLASSDAHLEWATARSRQRPKQKSPLVRAFLFVILFRISANFIRYRPTT
jgi:hypothetical protein